MTNTNSGDQYRPSLLDNLVGIGMKRSVVDERDEFTRRYPDSLVALGGIKVNGFAVSLSYERTLEPESAARGRRLFQEILHAVECAIGDFDVDADRVPDPQSSHESSPSVGDAEAGTSVVATPSVGDAAGPGVPPSTGPAAPSVWESGYPRETPLSIGGRVWLGKTCLTPEEAMHLAGELSARAVMASEHGRKP